MKVFGKKLPITRRGSLITIIVMMLGTVANTMAWKFFDDSHDQYMTVKVSADGFKARQVAVGGFQAGLSALKYIPDESFLYSKGLILNPPDIVISKDCKGCFVSYRLQPEDGKLNVNNLVQATTDEPNNQFRPVFERLFRAYNFEDPLAMVDSIIDWLDENDNTEAQGAEKEYYDALIPAVKIKNFRLFSLSEICQIKEIGFKKIYTSQAPEGWLEEQKDLKFQTEDEKLMIQEQDWIPANNLTAFIPLEGNFEDKINVNAARYHALMSLSEGMTDEAVKALFKYRRENGNYIKDLGALKTLPEFQTKVGEVTLYDELVGSGTEISGLLKTKGEFYRIVGVGSIVPPADKNKKVKPVIRRVTGIYDNNSKKLILYFED